MIEALYAAVVVASRHPDLFTDLGMSDTFEGRFDCLTLHTALVLRRLNALAVPGPEMAQDLIDTVFQHFDRT
ncbi:ubiquinol-cytochrome C chaperone family protein, partial [Beijerinckia sp. L45]|uniref:ubiquinol-cytochrome C chaperone family protein n=1 Tax=Beijerinckia sp. L45 TaxID=1641855 RepID=UPI00273812E3